MTRYKLEVEFEAEGTDDAFDWIQGFELSLRPYDDNSLIAVSLRDLEGSLSLSAQFGDSLESKPISVSPVYPPGVRDYPNVLPTPTWTVNTATATDGEQAEKDVAIGLDPTVATLAGLS